MKAEVTAIAHPNIALVKYWGKRDRALNLPAAGSISITLSGLRTRTTVRRLEPQAPDRFELDGVPREDRRVLATIERFRSLSGQDGGVEVVSDNDFPTAAGLASSASGFAALVTALTGLYDLDLSPARRSVLARLGSGSAARSIFGGFAEMREGERADGEDAHAVPLLGAAEWPLEVVIAITAEGPKAAGSTGGMEDSRRTSPFYDAWVRTTREDLDVARGAIEARDFATLAEISEHSALKMHATMLATRPPLVYWNPGTVAVIHAVRELRAAGHGAFLTIDAGPQVKVICPAEDAPALQTALADVPGVLRVLRTGLGEGARLLEP